MLNPDTTVSVSLLLSAISCLGVIVTLIKGFKSSGKEDAEGIVKANVKLDSICNSLSEMRVDVRSLNSRIDEIAKKQAEHDIEIRNLKDQLRELHK